MASDPHPLRVIIVGAGFCGLTAAIECKLRGLHPILIDAYPGPSSHGDLLDFVRNAGRVFESWDNGKVGKRLAAAGLNAAKYMEFFNSQNQLLRTDVWPQGTDFQYVYAGHRGEMHEIVFDYAVQIDVEMRMNSRVVQYLDSDEERGVVLANGDKILGDAVLAADGPRSLARAQLLKLPETKVNSGYAIFRAYFNITDELKQRVPGIKEMLKEGEDTARAWVGRDMHGFIYTWKNGKDCAWVLTHKDDTDIAESWSFPAKKTDVSRYLSDNDWPQIWHDILEATPEERMVDYKLVWREPLATWLSSSKKCAVMGDAAHCHLPTSAQGACQAVEDAAVAAICLQKADGDAALGLQVFERIRFNRSHTIHQASISCRNIYHKSDWTPELVQKHPNSLIIPLLDWITEYNLFEVVDEQFDRIAGEVRSGKMGKMEEMALPPGGDYGAMEFVDDETGVPKESVAWLKPVAIAAQA